MKHSEETKEKIRQSRLGTRMSQEIKNKISESRTGVTAGENNPAWIGGRWTYWKQQTKLRDDYICQRCGFSDKEIMIVDHILPRSVYPELELDINNLQTLCPNCNAKKTLQDIKKYQTGNSREDTWKIPIAT